MTNFRLQWFKDRIGKRVFRGGKPWDCDCEACKISQDHGFVIRNEDNAKYLHMLECENIAKYFDTKEEAEQFKWE